MIKLIIGCGYLGRRVAHLWLKQGQRVLATTRRPAAWHDSLMMAPNFEPIVCDVLRPETLQNLPQVDTVLYAVGFDRASGASMRSVYVDGVANVLERLPPPNKFIYISSSSVYGQTDGAWVDEDFPTEPEEDAGKIVLAAEKAVQAKMPDAVILRFAGIYGPGRLLRQKAIQAGEVIVADANRWLNLIHVEDGARAVLAAEEQGRPGRIYNVADGNPVQRHAFYSLLARQLAAPEPRFTPPAPETAAPPHEKSNRRISAQRMREELRVTLRYPDYESGIRTSLAE
jgi:nucleoside-diphosphate-sugar epimerase